MKRVYALLDGSVVCRVLFRCWNWLMAQWDNSRIVRAFLAPVDARWGAAGKSSVFNRLWQTLHTLLCRIFALLRLDKVLEGSLFRRSFFWCALTVFFAPILPTKAVILLALAGYGSLLLNFGCEPRRSLACSSIDCYVLLYGAIYLVSIFTSVTPSGSFTSGILVVLFIGYFFVVQNSVTTRRQLDMLLLCLVVGGTAVALYGCYQGVTGSFGDTTWVDSDMFSEIEGRVYSTLQNPNVLSEYLLLVIPFSAAGVLTAEKWRNRAGYGVCFVILCLCMVLTYSRGGWLGLLFALAIFLVMLDRRFLWLGLVGLVALYFLLPETVIGRFTSIGNLEDSSTSYRVYIWLGTLRMLKDYWICGVGPGEAAFNAVYPFYSYQDVTAQHSHSLYLQTLCDTGIIGLVVFLLGFFLFFKRMFGQAVREKDRKSRIWIIASLSSVAGFLVQSATDYSFYNYRVMLCFWIALAIGMLLCRRSSLPEKGNTDD